MKNLAPIDEAKDIVDKEYVDDLLDSRPAYVAQPEAPADTSVLWIDTDDDTSAPDYSAYGMGVQVHGSNVAAIRPTGFAQVMWIGTVEPANANIGDIWVDTN